jgi:hypothetical protein
MVRHMPGATNKGAVKRDLLRASPAFQTTSGSANASSTRR